MSLSSLVRSELGVQPSDATFDSYAGLALRVNPRRAHLIVSRTLGKHIPVSPALVLGAATELGDLTRAELVRDEVACDEVGEGASGLVIGYCETATGLGHGVADALGWDYLHTTRRTSPHAPVAVAFEEEHSHATGHWIQPGADFDVWGPGPLVLVDDELTTGTTALNTLAELHRIHPRERYVVATLLDALTATARSAFEARALDLGLDVTVVALHRNELSLPADILERADAVRAALPPGAPVREPVAGTPTTRAVHPWPMPGTASTARHGMSHAESRRLGEHAAGLAAQLAAELDALGATQGSVLVLGTEELMHFPALVAARLETLLTGQQVSHQTTTRSPVRAANTDGYALRRTVTFTCPDDPSRDSLVHNLFHPDTDLTPQEWAEQTHAAIVVVSDAEPAACASMLDALQPYTQHLSLVSVPFATLPAETSVTTEDPA